MKKKNKSLRQQREEEKNQRQQQLARETSGLTDCGEMAQAVSQEQNGQERTTRGKKVTKQIGLKSVFVMGEDKLLLTSFGHGNEAVREKHIAHNECVSLPSGNNPYNAEVNNGRKVIELEAVSGRAAAGLKASVGNPLYKPGDDRLGFREKLEKLYFGRTFVDNIHIQMIYAIQDIDKILSFHVNNIVYELNNLFRRDEVVRDDFIGNIGLDKTYDGFLRTNNGRWNHFRELFHELMEMKRASYYGSVLRDEALWDTYNDAKGERAKAEAKQKLDEKKKDAYYIIALLGMIRQSMAHGSIDNCTAIYTLAEKEGEKFKEAKAVLDSLYRVRINDLNANFIQYSDLNLLVLKSIFFINDQNGLENLVHDYYDFIVRKEYKYFGFSIKRIREYYIDTYMSETKEKKYDSVRSKMNRLFDFVLYRYYKDNTSRGKKLVDSLRASANEEQKEALYRKEAVELHGDANLRDRLNTLPKKLDPEVLDRRQKTDAQKGHKTIECGADQSMIDDYSGKIGEGVHIFTKLIYMLTCFLDGKEINDLLTTLINKFDVIASFQKVMKEEGLCGARSVPEMTKNYKLFEESEKICKELSIVNSFARMQKPSAAAKEEMFKEAAVVLGYANPDEAEELLREMLSGTDGDHTFRNFIANNVIESDRFKYLARYANVNTVRFLAQNERVIKFVLKDIPKPQIDRYYLACRGVDALADEDEERKWLCNSIMRVSFALFKDVPKANDKEKRKERERDKAVVRLYLTVLYLLVKNLVYMNSRYFLAFHCVERDSVVYDETGKLSRDITQEKEFSVLAKAWLKQHNESLPPLGAEPGEEESTGKKMQYKRMMEKHRVAKYLWDNFENSNSQAVRDFRNCVEHLNAVRNASKYINDIGAFNSYFELYHYLLQRSIMDAIRCDIETAEQARSDLQNGKYTTEKEISEANSLIASVQAYQESKIPEYFALVTRYGTYCKDLVKALNVPFAYNLPRYKNLSIDDLFDRNNMRECGQDEPLNIKKMIPYEQTQKGKMASGDRQDNRGVASDTSSDKKEGKAKRKESLFGSEKKK